MKLKKLALSLLIFIFALVIASCNSQELNFTKKEKNIYYKTLDNKSSVDVYYSNSDKECQIPYITLETWALISNKIYNDGIGDYPCDVNYELTVSHNGDIGTLKRENNTSMVFNFKSNTITFDNYDRYIAHSFDVSPQELPHQTGYDSEGNSCYFLRVDREYNYTYGNILSIDLNKYNIEIAHARNTYIVPIQTLCDLTLNLQYCNILYNSSNIYVMDYVTSTGEVSKDTGLIHDYYLDTNSERSKQLIEFTYNELCLLFDYNYGLKEQHHISSFNDYFSNTYNNGKSLKEYFLSEDPALFEQGMAYLTNRDLNDLHSSYIAASSYAGKTTSVDYSCEAFERLYNVFIDLITERAQAYPDGMPGYEEIGNTAFISFDNFFSQSKNYYTEEATASAPDTVGLMIYAYSQVYRDGSPVENVVLDLSCNLGGYEDAVLYVCGMFTGKFNFTLYNPITNCVSNSVYQIDANMDHQFDSHDWFYNKNLYCITSECSFSCGNVAPSILKANTNVTMLGRRSGGGGCIVCPFTTASGGWYQTSSSKVIMINHLNSYYISDSGVEVDYRFDKIESYYDRTEIVNFINNLQ